MKRLTLQERFEMRVQRDPISNCWIWTGYKTPQGYGRIRIADEMWLAHRAAWLIYRSADPQDLCLCHSCDNPPCVNPEHLFLGTRKDNYDDAIKKNRYISPISVAAAAMVNKRKTATHCKRGHLIDGVRTNGRRYCKICHTKMTMATRNLKYRKLHGIPENLPRLYPTRDESGRFAPALPVTNR